MSVTNLDPNAGIPRTMRRDPPRPGGRLRILVHVSPRSTSIPGVHGPTRHGRQEVIIHASDLDKVRGLVETELSLIPRCEATVKRKQREWIAEKTGRDVESIPTDPAHWDEQMVKAEARFPGNMPAEFANLTGRGIRPLLPIDSHGEGEIFGGLRSEDDKENNPAGGDSIPGGVVVLEELPTEMDRSHEMARAIAAEMAAAGVTAGSNTETLELRQMIDELRKSNEQLAGQLAELQAEAKRRKGGRPPKE